MEASENPPSRPLRFVCPDCASAHAESLSCRCGGQRVDTFKDAVKDYLQELDEEAWRAGPQRRGRRAAAWVASVLTVVGLVGATFLPDVLAGPLLVAHFAGIPAVYYVAVYQWTVRRARREPRFGVWTSLPSEEAPLDPSSLRGRAQLRGYDKAMERGAKHGWSGGV